jgi:hypothetical protein
MDPDNMSDDGAQDLSIEQTIANTFNAINALLSKPMANYHRPAFRSLIVHTMRNVMNATSFSMNGGGLFYNDAIAQQVVTVFLLACADKIWPNDYSGDHHLTGEEEGRKVRLLLVWYVIKLLEAGTVDNAEDGDPEAVVEHLNRRLQIDDVIDRTREVRQTESVPDLRSVGGDRSWTIESRRDVAVQIARARRKWEADEQQFEENFEQRRIARRENFDGYLSSSEEG